jgi:hypothetical protein
MVGHIFTQENTMFATETRDGVMISYNGSRDTTTVFNIYIHDVHADVSDAVDRNGVWVPLATVHWKEIRDNLNLDASGPEDIEMSQVEDFVQNGPYEELVEVSTK